nr:transcription antitermination factor NusB [Oscillospiraceae bacterium]
MAETTRILAAKAGMRVSSGGYSNLTLDSALRNSKLDARDKAFAAALFYGTLERRITLDREIARFCSRPLEKLTPAVLESLRLGFYQILYMDSVPDSAAVSESVELVKTLGAASASGFVNGVLRSFLRSGGKTDFGALPPTERLSAEYAAPLWLCEMWTAAYGTERAE